MTLQAGDSVLVIGSGPIRIGQGCEFDYSCTQACRALRERGMRVLLVNPNPATIMTDPETADDVFIEPLDPDVVTRIMEETRPTGLLATMGGQEGLNLALELERRGVLERTGTELLGISSHTIEVAEDRQLFKEMLEREGFGAIPGCVVHKKDLAELDALTAGMSYPLIIRASFTLGGSGGATVSDPTELKQKVREAFEASADRPITIEQSIVGWREYELEVMADGAGSFVVVAAVENINPMGVHTGDSITVVPTFTLRDHELQNMRDAARSIFRALGMRIGGANIQFAIHPTTGQMVVVEMNPRVSRSSALVSKATGYPIAYISTLLALGHRLDELPNEITGQTCAAYEPVIDYVGVKIPKFNFEKIAPRDGHLGVSMKSVGEVLAFGSSFMEAMSKAWRSLESGFYALPSFEEWCEVFPALRHLEESNLPSIATLPLLKSKLLEGASIESISNQTAISSYFVKEMAQVFEAEKRLVSFAQGSHSVSALQNEFQATVTLLKRSGYAKSWIQGKLAAVGATESFASGLLDGPSCFRLVDSCAGEFEAKTPYFYSTAEAFLDENRVDQETPRVVILGSGPNRIGQGIEFDSACVHACLALKARGHQAIMINSNPETVSTDYRVADKLYVEPLDEDAILDVLRAERPQGVLLQFGGQTPIQLAAAIERAGFSILGTSRDKMDLCENRDRFEALLDECGLHSPVCKSYRSLRDAQNDPDRPPYPVLIRPSFVIGGQGMQVVHNDEQLEKALGVLPPVSEDSPLIVQEFLEGGTEYDVDLLCDGTRAHIVGILRHLDPPGIHSGDSVGEWLSAHSEEYDALASVREICSQLALQIGVKGFLNVQLVLRGTDLHILEANPRASRTVPFLAKAGFWGEATSAGQNPVAAGTLLCLGHTLDELQEAGWSWLNPHSSDVAKKTPVKVRHAFKFPVFPYAKFAALDAGPGPEMHSLGEVMGQADSRLEAFLKGALSALWAFPRPTEKRDASEPLRLWFDTPETEARLGPLLTEMDYLWQRMGVTTLRLTEPSTLESADVLFALDYFARVGGDKSLRVQLARAMGLGKPVLFGLDSASLCLNVLARLAAHELDRQSDAREGFYGFLGVGSLPQLKSAAFDQETCARLSEELQE